MGEENLENEVLLRGIWVLKPLLCKGLENLEEISKKNLAGVIDLMGVGGKLSPEGFYKFVHLPPLHQEEDYE